MAGAAVIRATYSSEVNARCGGTWNCPRRRNRPTAAVDQTSRIVAETVRLILGQRDRWRDGGDLSSSHSAVIAHSVDIEPVVRGVRIDLETDRLATIHADVSGKPLNRRVAGPGHIPFTRRISRQRVLAGDGISVRWRTGRRRLGAYPCAVSDIHRDDDHRQYRGEQGTARSGGRALRVRRFMIKIRS